MFLIDAFFKPFFRIKDFRFTKYKLANGDIVSIRDDGFTLWTGGEVKSCSWEDFKVMNDAIRRITNRG